MPTFCGSFWPILLAFLCLVPRYAINEVKKKYCHYIFYHFNFVVSRKLVITQGHVHTLHRWRHEYAAMRKTNSWQESFKDSRIAGYSWHQPMDEPLFARTLKLYISFGYQKSHNNGFLSLLCFLSSLPSGFITRLVCYRQRRLPTLGLQCFRGWLGKIYCRRGSATATKV